MPYDIMSYDIEASEWLNTSAPPGIAASRGRVVLVTVFQMLCPGCAQLSLPQANNLHATFAREDLMVIGMHSVFEHHRAMTPDSLRVFAKEYRLRFPIAIDRSREGSPIPETMQRWGLNGTPSMVVFGRDGELALKHFGHLDDLRLGALLGGLIAHRSTPATHESDPGKSADSGPVCAIP